MHFAFLNDASGVAGTDIPAGFVLDAERVVEVKNADASAARFVVLRECPAVDWNETRRVLCDSGGC